MRSSVTFETAVTPLAKAPSKASPVFTGRVTTSLGDAASQMKLSVPCDPATWPFAELDYEDVAFDPFDPLQGYLEHEQGIPAIAA